MFLWNRQPLSKAIGAKWRYFKELFECPLCLGVWTYWALALLLRINIIEVARYIPALSEFLTGTITAFIMWLVWLGWNQAFQAIFVAGEK